MHDVTIFPGFSMTLLYDKQLEIINQIPIDKRILHISANNSSIKINKRVSFNYDKILNYVMLLRDQRVKEIHSVDNEKTVIIGELVSSNNDYYTIGSKLIDRVKCEFMKLYEQDLKFKIITCDYSWSMVQALLQFLNNESIEMYSKRVFNLSIGKVSKILVINYDYLKAIFIK